ncbi:hypothetical protein GOC59_07350 [Sinorhizobium medicae]|nr:hypothetical protein [Sinorhizobium medicae]MDX0994699.1 hypothetical protein [Sinorhizobium medicae]MDX1178559.1 hypothetical protein [Sinorhizobium medicae]MQY01196.1 hypothetical protein [Sinorhizobium medicae]
MTKCKRPIFRPEDSLLAKSHSPRFARLFNAIGKRQTLGTAFAFAKLLPSTAIEASPGAAYACQRHRRRKVFASVRVSPRSAISERRFFMPVSAGNETEPT